MTHLKKYLIIILAGLGLSTMAQNKLNQISDKGNANSVPNSNSKNIGSATTQSIAIQTLRHDTCLNKKFSIVVYTFEDSSMTVQTNSMAIITADVTAKINYLNTVFKRICVSFESCRIVIIPNYMYSRWSNAAVENVVYNNYHTDNTINLYMPQEMQFSRCIGDYAFLPDSPTVGGPKLMVVSPRGSAGGASLAHAFGHLFGLYHTFDEINPTPANPAPPTLTVGAQINSDEFVDGSNCALYGDRICDTEADPYPANTAYNRHHTMCDYNGGIKDGKGHFYTPPLDNYMSYYSCRCRFTQQQFNRMADIIRTKRLMLH